MSENCVIGSVSTRIEGDRLGVPGCTVAGGVHISRTTGQNKGVQFRQLVGKLFRRLLKRYFPWFCTRLPDSVEVEVQLVAFAFALFLRGAPGDAHTWPGGSAQMSVSGHHGTPNRSIRAGGRQPVGREKGAVTGETRSMKEKG